MQRGGDGTPCVSAAARRGAARSAGGWATIGAVSATATIEERDNVNAGEPEGERDKVNYFLEGTSSV